MRIEPLTEEHAREIAEWRYEFPYEWYDTASDQRRIELFANPARREGLRAVVADDGELIGFFNFVREGDEVRVGLGIRPDLTGRGLGAQFIEAGLRYAADVVDTTGAGDAFAAGFLLGGSLEEAARRGLEAAARCVAQVGALP